MDPLLEEGPEFTERDSRLDGLRRNLLAPHARFTWRYRSFGSSANNHLIGELAGLIVASVRWPDLAGSCADLTTLCLLWEKEVLAQFAEDGGNREQALNYHLFSWELCLHAELALAQAKMEVSPTVNERLQKAARYFVSVQADNEPWDYGDSDNALVAPLVCREEQHPTEWKGWLEGRKSSAPSFWIGRQKNALQPSSGWQHFAPSGYLTFRSEEWFLRWDVSPLGYLQTAAHGHLDALHLSLWHRGKALVVDPGTGAYYGDPELRDYLASGKAHNGPCPISDQVSLRRGPFLWSDAHAKPTVAQEGSGFRAELTSAHGKLTRSLLPLNGNTGWEINDGFATEHLDNAFTVLWQFAPGIKLEQTREREFEVSHTSAKLVLQVGQNWSGVELGLMPLDTRAREGTVSPYFRKKDFGQFLKLGAPTHRPCAFQTRFLACGGE
jgi:hypothetical protein